LRLPALGRQGLVVRRVGGAALVAAANVLAWGPAAAQTAVPCDEASLRAAIDGAGTGAVLVLPDGCTITLTGAPGEENNQSGDLDVNVNTAATSLAIQGAGPGRTTIDGGGIDRVIDIFAGKSLTLRHLTIRNGDGTRFVTREAGGIYHGGDTLTLENVEVIGNIGTKGGGIFATATATVALTNVTLAGNVTTIGEGGGLFANGPATLTNVTVSGNAAVIEGGGIYVGGTGTVSLANVTIAANTAGGTGGGGLFVDGATTFTDTIIAGNSAPGGDGDCAVGGGTLTSSGHNLVQAASPGCAFAPGAGDQTGVDPGLAPLANNGGLALTHALRPGSPAVDAGGAGCATSDQRGVGRAGPCDIGAFELIPSLTSLRVNQVGYDTGDVLSVTVGVFNPGPAVTVDAYLGFLLPVSTIPGCPATQAFVTGGAVVTVCGATAPLGTLPRLGAGITVPASPTPTFVTLLSAALPGGVPPGLYTAFFALTNPNVLADGSIGPGDILSAVTIPFVIH
jgi:hypothetical protein